MLVFCRYYDHSIKCLGRRVGFIPWYCQNCAVHSLFAGLIPPKSTLFSPKYVLLSNYNLSYKLRSILSSITFWLELLLYSSSVKCHMSTGLLSPAVYSQHYSLAECFVPLVLLQLFLPYSFCQQVYSSSVCFLSYTFAALICRFLLIFCHLSFTFFFLSSRILFFPILISASSLHSFFITYCRFLVLICCHIFVLLLLRFHL